MDQERPNFSEHISSDVDNLNKALHYEYMATKYREKVYLQLKESLQKAIQEVGQQTNEEQIDMLATTVKNELLKQIVTSELEELLECE